MADEAVLRIVMQGAGSQTGSPTSAPPTSTATVPAQSYHHTAPITPTVPTVPTPTVPAAVPIKPHSPKSDTSSEFDPVEIAKRRIEREDQQAQVDIEYAKLKPAPLPSLTIPFDPIAAAIKRIEREDQLAAVDAEYAKLRPTTPPTFDPVEEAKKRLESDKRRAAVDLEYEKLNPAPPFNPAEEAQKRLENDKRRAAIDAEYAKLIPPEPPFDPVEEAKKRLEADKKRWAIDEEYAKIRPPEVIEVEPPFDPQVEAKKRREKEVQREQVDQAYKERYGTPDTELDKVLKVADNFRGLLGATFGRGVGAILDLIIGLRKEQVTAPKPTAPTVPTRSVPTANPATLSAVLAPSGAGSGLGAMAAAALPPFLIVSAAMAVRQAVFDGVKGAIGTAGRAVSAIASANPDPAVPIAKFGDTISKVGEKIPILGDAAVVAGESLKALSEVMQELNRTADRYGEFNPQIAQAQAIAEVRQVMGDLRRAQQIGPEMAKFVMAQSDLQQKFEDIKIRLLNKIIPIVTRILEILEVVVTIGEPIVSTLAAPLVAMAEVMAQLLNLQRDAQLKEVKDPTTQLFNPMFMEPGLGHDWDPGWVPRR